VNRSPVDNSDRLLGSALKCLALIEELAACREPVGVADLAKRLDSRRGTVHQQLRTLVAAAWVEQLDNARYRLTLRPVSIGAAVLEQADLGSRVLPTLTALAAETGETASIAVLYRGSALILQRVAADRVLTVDIKPGTGMPLTVSASGRVLVAFADEHELAQLSKSDAAMPDQGIVEAARRSGFAEQLDEYVAGMSSMAVPLTGTKLGTAALALTAPTERFDSARLLPKLAQARDELVQILGW
jgi:DNA-binding IclR family transcriptional regulator